MEISIIYGFIFLLSLLIYVYSTATYKFRRFSTGEDLIYSDTFLDIRSAIQCGALCAEKRQNGGVQPICEAYSYRALDRTCQLYVEQVDGADAAGVQIYKYYVIDPDPTDGFEYIQSGGQTYIFYVASTKSSYQDAKAHCQSLGSYLVNFDSVDEFDAFIGFLQDSGMTHRAWVGANDLANEGDWVTELHGLPFDRTIWRFSATEPNNYAGNEDCAVLRMDRLFLYDVPCHYTYYAGCEKTP